MNLYCRKCNDIHHFTADDAERIIYCLQASLSDQICGAQFEDTQAPGGEEFDCLTDILYAHSWDQEVYAEHVNGEVESRVYFRALKTEWREQVFSFEGVEVWRSTADSRRVPLYELWTTENQEKHGEFCSFEEALNYGESPRASGYLEAITE